jgi:hypothetical protein
MTGEVERTIVQPAADAGKDGRAHRWLYIGGALVLVGIAYLAWSLFAQQQQIGALTVSGSITADRALRAEDQATQLAGQVRSLGATPVVQPAPAPAAPAGQNGIPGTNGTNGTAGLNGRDGASPACLATAQQCQGAAGQNGTNGKAGQPGQDGKDGQDGKPGANGTNGTNGKDGQPPSSWTTTYPDGSVETCSRTADFNPNAPTYTCTVQPPPSPTPTDVVLPPGLVTPNRRRT